MKSVTALCLLVALFVAGCEKPGPIELIDDGGPSQTIEIDTTNDSQSSLNPTNDDIDSSGLFGAIGGRTFGQIMIAGARYDAANEHHQASVAQATFFDKNQPIVFRGDTVAYRILNAGDLKVNALQLFRYPKRIKSSPPSLLDTLLGFQYGLYNNDGIGGRGFQYTGSTTYRWEGTGSFVFPVFTESLKTPPLFRVTSPAVGDEIDPSKNLRFKVEGDVSELTILIQKKPALIENLNEKPLLRLKVKKERNEVVIPAGVMKLLPRQQHQIIFSFQIERTKIVRISGYPFDVQMCASYVHHLALKIRR